MTKQDTRILALAYYDGATEGFLDGMEGGRVYFFKVVAWDRDQDRRLYLLGLVARAVYMELVDIMARTQPAPTSSTWVPRWIFENSDHKARANELVEVARQALDDPAMVLLGEDLLSKTKPVSPSAKGLANAIALAREEEPGDLDGWLAHDGL